MKNAQDVRTLLHEIDRVVAELPADAQQEVQTLLASLLDYLRKRHARSCAALNAIECELTEIFRRSPAPAARSRRVR